MYTKEITFTETATAGTYTATVAVKANERLLDAEWETTANFAADTAALSVGRSGALTDFFSSVNVKSIATGAYSLGASVGKEGYKFTANNTITLTLVTTGTGGTTGRLRVLLTIARPIQTLAAAKA